MTLKGSESLRLERFDRLAQLDKHQTSKPVMFSCELISTGGNFIFLLKLLRHFDANFVQNVRNFRFVLLMKTLIVSVRCFGWVLVLVIIQLIYECPR